VKVNVSVTSNMEQVFADLPRRMANMGRVIGRELAARTAHEVKKRIPGGGWLSIYRDAIDFFESTEGREWAVAGMAPIELKNPPAEKTLIGFEGKEALGKIMEAYNPWPVDLLPAIQGGFEGPVVARAASPADVEDERKRIALLMPTIRAALIDAGAKIFDKGTPHISGRVYADIAFLARKLELGYEGFPHIPHWTPASSKLRTNYENWTADPAVISKVAKALSGADLANVTTMSAEEAATLRKLRKATWP